MSFVLRREVESLAAAINEVNPPLERVDVVCAGLQGFGFDTAEPLGHEKPIRVRRQRTGEIGLDARRTPPAR